MNHEAQDIDADILAMLESVVDDPIPVRSAGDSERFDTVDTVDTVDTAAVNDMKRRLTARLRASQGLEAEANSYRSESVIFPAQQTENREDAHQVVGDAFLSDDPFARALIAWSQELSSTVRTTAAPDATRTLRVDNEAAFEAMVGRSRRSQLEPWPVFIISTTASGADSTGPSRSDSRALNVRLNLPDSPHQTLRLVIRFAPEVSGPVIVTADINRAATSDSVEFEGTAYVPATCMLRDVEVLAVDLRGLA